jgi:cell division transport system permease protein
MAANRPIVEVLHFIGATDGFISGQFQRHFLFLGLRGGLIGGGGALILFVLASLLSNRLSGTAGGDEIAALFGSFAIGWFGYATIVAQVIVVAAVTAGTSREVVNRTLRAMA